jgi:hypothetical protein
METRVNRGQMEDRMTGMIEAQTSRLPSVAYLIAAGAAMTASLLLKAQRKDHMALWIGQWAPSILILGIYNKMVKQLGSDASSRRAA